MRKYRNTGKIGCRSVKNLGHVVTSSVVWLGCRLLVLLSVFACSSTSFAQEVTNRIESNEELPDAPAIRSAVPIQLPLPSQGANAALSGSVADINGYLVPGAHVTLTERQLLIRRVAASDELGKFSFSDLPSGSYYLTIDSTGLQSYTSEAIVLRTGDSFQLPPFALPLPTENSDVQVIASQDQVAQAQVKLAEGQRVLGIVPNFYSSYIWDAAPMTAKLKFDLAFRSTTDPVAFLMAGAVAGIEHSHNTFPGYESGAEGYAKRYAAAYGDNVIGRLVGSAILPSLLHQDPRYFYKGKGSVTSRALYAIGATFIARGDNGHLQPNYSHILGNFAAAGLSNLYRTQGDRSATLTIRNGFIITGTNAVGNLVREFLLKGMTHNVPTFAQGQP